MLVDMSPFEIAALVIFVVMTVAFFAWVAYLAITK